MALKETVEIRRIPATIITGPKSTGGIITGDPSRDLVFRGGGGRTQTDIDAEAREQALERARREAEAKRLAEEQAKQRAKDEQDRQEKIKSGTIAGQIYNKPNVYISSNPNWRPTNDPNAVVTYINKYGKTTGKTSIEGLNIDSGFDVRASYKTKSGIKYGRDLIGFEYEKPTKKTSSSATSGLFGGGFDTVTYPNVTLQTNALGFSTDRGTRQDMGMSYKTTPIRNPGDIFKVQTGSIKGTPIFETKVINPDWSSRPATASERSQLDAVIKMRDYEAIAGQDAPSKAERYYKEKKGDILGFSSGIISNAVGGYTELNKLISEKITDPAISKVESSTGLNFSLNRDWEKERQNLVDVGVPLAVVKPFEFVAGAGLGLIEEVRYKPLKTAVVYGGSVVGGYAIKGATAGTVYGATRLFGASYGGATGTLLTTSTTGAGLFLGGTYVAKKGVEVSNLIEAGQYGQAGAITGVTGKDVAVSLFGFQKGAKVWDITEGAIRTGGRVELEVPQGVYPTAKPSKQLELFNKNYYEELGGRGAFHTTGSKFWKGGTIDPKTGTSELSGLYASTQVSTPFARVSGGGSNTRLLPNWKDLIAGNEPAIAYIKPQGFRQGNVIWKNVPEFSGQKYIKGKGYAWWKNPPQEGFADVPGIKTEIEAIFRPDSGKYIFESGKYYTKIEGVNVPIDTFIYGGGSGSPTINIPTTTKVFSSNYYGGYSSPVILNPSSGVTLYSGGSKGYTIPKYSISSSAASSPSISLSSLASSRPNISYIGKSDKSKPSSNTKSYLSSVSSRLSSSSISSLYSSNLSSSSSSSSGSSSGSSLIKKSTSRVFGLPKIKIKDKTKKKSQRGKQRTQYQPSFTASALNIKAVKAPLITGISVRPIISKRIKAIRKKEKSKKRRDIFDIGI